MAEKKAENSDAPKKSEVGVSTENSEKKKLVVDKNSCIACGTCYGGIAPELFESDEEGKSEVIKQPEGEDEVKKAMESIDSCPSQAISY